LASDQRADSLVELNPVAPLRKWLWVAASLAVIAAVGYRDLALPRPEAPRASALVASPITTYPGREVYPSFSPDATQVAFAWTVSGRTTSTSTSNWPGRRGARAFDH